MHYEKAEHILQQMMAGDRNMYLVRDARDGRAVITDKPKEQQKVVGELKWKPASLMTRIASVVLFFLSYI